MIVQYNKQPSIEEVVTAWCTTQQGVLRAKDLAAAARCLACARAALAHWFHSPHGVALFTRLKALDLALSRVSCSASLTATTSSSATNDSNGASRSAIGDASASEQTNGAVTGSSSAGSSSSSSGGAESVLQEALREKAESTRLAWATAIREARRWLKALVQPASAAKCD
jgi:hypothetical protein